MPNPRTLQEAIYATLHRSRKPLAEIAEEIGSSANLLYRYCADEESSSFADFPLRRLLPIIIATENNSLLDYLELKRGRIAVDLPNFKILKRDESEIVTSYQECTIEAIHTLRKFLCYPDEKHLKTVEDSLHRVMTESGSLKEYVKAKYRGQFELEFNEQ